MKRRYRNGYIMLRYTITLSLSMTAFFLSLAQTVNNRVLWDIFLLSPDQAVLYDDFCVARLSVV